VTLEHEPSGSAQALLHKNEIHKLLAAPSQGLTVIREDLLSHGIAKVEIALAQGKKSWDRRQDERTKKLAGKWKNPCIATGGDNAHARLRWRPSRSRIETDALVSYVFEETDLVQGRIAESIRPAQACCVSSQKAAN